jgi:hypothetical protein
MNQRIQKGLAVPPGGRSADLQSASLTPSRGMRIANPRSSFLEPVMLPENKATQSNHENTTIDAT